MKRLLTIFMLLAVSLGSLFATWGTDVSIGILSTIGVTYDIGKFEFDAKFDSTFGVGGLLSNAFMDKITDAELTTKDKLSIGNKLVYGATVNAFYKAVDTNHFQLAIGPEVNAYRISCKKGIISHLTKAGLVLFALDSKVSYKINNKNSVYLNVGFPLLAYINYGGDADSHNYMGFDFWAFIPTAVKQVEDGKWAEGLGKKVALALFALDLRLGYTYRFK